MKLINKFFIGSLCLGLLTLASCNKGDDDGPTEPAYQGSFTGTIIDYTALIPEETDFVATSITATHDTLAFSGPSVKIEVENASGVKIIIELPDTTAQPQPYYLRSTTTAKSTITFGANNGPYTTVTDDIPSGSNSGDNGVITITDGGSNDGILRGTISVINWYKVIPAMNDSLRAVLHTSSFEVPLKRKGISFEPGEATISAKIDGENYVPLITNKFGFTLVSSSATGESLQLTIPESATLGEHVLDSEYSVIYTHGSELFSTEGTMNITAFDGSAGTATGTFEFTATPNSGGSSVSITEGSFTF